MVVLMPSIKSSGCCLLTKLCPTLCKPMDCSPPGSSVHGISQARILESVAISSSIKSKQRVTEKKAACLSPPQSPRPSSNASSSGRLPQWLRNKESACSAGDMGSIPGSGRFPGEGSGNPLQYSCLENPMDGGAWWATVHGVTQSRT